MLLPVLMSQSRQQYVRHREGPQQSTALVQLPAAAVAVAIASERDEV
jgi:hypothetical protein